MTQRPALIIDDEKGHLFFYWQSMSEKIMWCHIANTLSDGLSS